MRKITIVGAGRVGEASAQILAERELCSEVALLDVRDDVPSGVALDVNQTAPLFAFDTRVTGSSDPRILKGSELVVVTASVAPEPGFQRGDALAANLPIVDRVTDQIATYAPDAMVLVVSHPADTLTYRIAQRTGWPRERVIGQAGVLDASRMASFIAQETGFSALDITAMVIGGQGDLMVPLPRYCTVNGVPISKFIGSDRMDAIMARTRRGGAEILALRKTSSATDAPAAAVAAMIDSIVHNRRRLLPAVAILEGEYGEADIAAGVPCVLSDKGLETVVEVDLTEQERDAFARALNQVRNDIERLARQA